jgi:competence protein ComEC
MVARPFIDRFRRVFKSGLLGEGFYARPIIALLLALIAGIIIGVRLPGYAWIGLAIFGGSAAAAAVRLRRHENSRLAPLFMFLSLGYLSLQAWLVPEFPPHHLIHFDGDRQQRIIGTIIDHPVRKQNRTRFILAAEQIQSDRSAITVTGKIRLTVNGWGSVPEIRRGDRLAVKVKIRPIRNFNNPGGFNYSRYMAFKGIWHSAYCRASEMQLLASETLNPLQQAVENLRKTVKSLIEMTSEGAQRGVMEALFLGDRSHIPEFLRAAFHRTGVGHLLAISGLHIGIVASVAFILFVRLFSHFPGLLWPALSRKLAAVCTVFPVLLYASLAGMSPSTQRAMLMVLVFLSTFLFEMDQDSVNTLAAAALAILIVHPPAFFTISFQLSFAAVFSILCGANLLYPESRKPEDERGSATFRLLKRRLFKFTLISIFATMGTLPLVLYYFNQISLIGIPANCLFVPLIGFAVVPLGLAGVFLSPFSATLAAWCMKLAAGILAPTLDAIATVGELPFAAVHTVTPSILEIICYYGFIWLAIHLIVRRRALVVKAGGSGNICRVRQQPPLTTAAVGAHRHWKSALAGLVFLLTIMIGDGIYWTYQRFWRQDLRITALDVGQGSAALLEFPKGRVMLIDGGGFPDNTVFDVGERIIAPFLWHKKIRTVETLVLSHPNSDHLNGLIFIADHFHVHQVWTNGEKHNTKGFQQFEKVIARHNIYRPDLAGLLQTRTINGVEVRVLYPPRDYRQRRLREAWRTINNNSLVLKAQLGDYAFLFPGDISVRAEKELVALTGAELKSAVLCVPHHGSISSSCAEFIDGVDPLIGFFSVGWRNRFKFPHPRVVERYRRRGVELLRTDQHGAMVFVTDGNRLSVTTYLKQDGQENATPNACVQNPS